jgi:peptidoglycan hydrolase-like protein with peptidoglycan-binding domain
MPATIRLGDSGDDVKRLQRVFARSKVLGPGNISGLFDQNTDQAVREFQQAHGLGVDGIVGALTWSQLPPYREASPTLSPGTVGPVVAMLQKVLQTSFGYTGAIDGRYGPITQGRVRQFQAGVSLPSTGTMDEQTWMAPAGAAGATLESLSGLIF